MSMSVNKKFYTIMASLYGGMIAVILIGIFVIAPAFKESGLVQGGISYEEMVEDLGEPTRVFVTGEDDLFVTFLQEEKILLSEYQYGFIPNNAKGNPEYIGVVIQTVKQLPFSQEPQDVETVLPLPPIQGKVAIYVSDSGFSSYGKRVVVSYFDEYNQEVYYVQGASFSFDEEEMRESE